MFSGLTTLRRSKTNDCGTYVQFVFYLFVYPFLLPHVPTHITQLSDLGFFFVCVFLCLFLFFLLFSPIPKKVSVVLADHKRADSKMRDKPLDKLLSMDEQRTGLGVGGWRGCGMHAGLWCCRGTQIVHSLDISCNKGLPLSTCCVAASRASVEWL